MREFPDLQVWQDAHRLTLAVYRATAAWPREEQFGLILQTRRSASSIAANIAEGHGRFGDAEFHHFCNIAKGSLAELQCHLMVARDLEYLARDAWQSIHEQTLTVSRQLQALMRRLRTQSPRAES